MNRRPDRYRDLREKWLGPHAGEPLQVIWNPRRCQKIRWRALINHDRWIGKYDCRNCYLTARLGCWLLRILRRGEDRVDIGWRTERRPAVTFDEAHRLFEKHPHLREKEVKEEGS